MGTKNISNQCKYSMLVNHSNSGADYICTFLVRGMPMDASFNISGSKVILGMYTVKRREVCSPSADCISGSFSVLKLEAFRRILLSISV